MLSKGGVQGPLLVISSDKELEGATSSADPGKGCHMSSKDSASRRKDTMYGSIGTIQYSPENMILVGRSAGDDKISDSVVSGSRAPGPRFSGVHGMQ